MEHWWHAGKVHVLTQVVPSDLSALIFMMMSRSAKTRTMLLTMGRRPAKIKKYGLSSLFRNPGLHVSHQDDKLACGGPGPDEMCSPPALGSQELNSWFLFFIHSPLLLCFWCHSAKPANSPVFFHYHSSTKTVTHSHICKISPIVWDSELYIGSKEGEEKKNKMKKISKSYSPLPSTKKHAQKPHRVHWQTGCSSLSAPQQHKLTCKLSITVQWPQAPHQCWECI